MYKKILVPLDGSQFGECSLDHVVELASPGPAPEVVLLAVMEPIMGASMLSSELGSTWLTDASKKMKEGMETYLSSIVERLKKKGINASKVMADGNAAEVILEYAAGKKVDLIMMSTHGRSGVVKWAIGGVADKVSRQSIIPVLLIAPKACR
jgi:nucleotide-binding universal stress UspA family protein